MTQEITLVPVDNRTADWPRKVATVLNRLQRTTMLAGGSATWGSITGTLSVQTDLASALSGKQATLVSGANIKSVNGSSLLGSGNLAVGTVTSVAVSVPAGFSIAGSPITGSGTLAITFGAGYSLPTDAAQATWNTAYGWGNHASAGYLTSSAIGVTVQAYDAQLDSLAALSYSGNALKVVRVNSGATGFELATVSAGLSDGDYGDITVGGSGTTLTIDNDVVTYAKMQNVSATSRILGRKTASAGDAEECTLSEILDFIGSAAQGDILYRGASGWARLGAGTSGQVLQTNGASANPSWVTPSGGGITRPSIVQVAGAIANNFNVTLGAAPTAGNLLVAFCSHWNNLTAPGTAWNLVFNDNGSSVDGTAMAVKIALVGDTAAQVPFVGGAGGSSTVVFEIQNAIAILPLNVVHADEVGSSPYSISIAGSRNSGLALGMLAVGGSNAAVTVGGGFTTDLNITGTTTSNSPRRLQGVHLNIDRGTAAVMSATFTPGNMAGILCEILGG